MKWQSKQFYDLAYAEAVDVRWVGGIEEAVEYRCPTGNGLADTVLLILLQLR